MTQKRIYFEKKENEAEVSYTYRNNWGCRFKDTTSVQKKPIGGIDGDREEIFLVYQNGEPIGYDNDYEIAGILAENRAEKRARHHASRFNAKFIRRID